MTILAPIITFGKSMFMSKFTFKSMLLSLLFIIPTFSFAAISEQDKVSFKNIYGSEIKSGTYTNIFDFCDKNNTDLTTCLHQLKALPSAHKSIKNQTSFGYCCKNISGNWGEYAYIHGQDYCIPPC